METKRQKQVAEVIRRNFGTVLQNEGPYIYGPEPLVTVTTVRVTPDFSLAKIYLSVYNTENKQEVILEMEEGKSRLKQALSYRLRKKLRKLPDIDFFLDDTLDEMYRISKLFDRLHEENQMGNSDNPQ